MKRWEGACPICGGRAQFGPLDNKLALQCPDCGAGLFERIRGRLRLTNVLLLCALLPAATGMALRTKIGPLWCFGLIAASALCLLLILLLEIFLCRRELGRRGKDS